MGSPATDTDRAPADELEFEEEVEDPIEQGADVIVRNVNLHRGSDLDMYEGRTDAGPGFLFGHENQGIV